MPRKLWKPTPAILNQITELSSQRWNNKQIAAELGITPSCFARKKMVYPEIQAAIERGWTLIAERAIATLPQPKMSLWERQMRGALEAESKKQLPQFSEDYK